jgi:hypothetical protein
MLYPYNPKYGQRIATDVKGFAVDRAFLAHIEISADKAPAASSDGVHEFVNLGEEAQSVTTGITNPAWPRNARIVGNVAGITGTVKIHGTSFKGEVIMEQLTANGTSVVDGQLAFKTITKIDLPAQTHTPAAQTETIQVTNGCTSSEEITVSVTATTLLGEDSGESVTVALDDTEHSTAAAVAAAVAEALNENDVISAVFEASSEDDVITLAVKEPATNDSSLEISFSVGTSGVTVGASTNGTTGVPYDQISVGWGDLLGLPYMLTHNTIIKVYFDGVEELNAPTVAMSADEIHKNTIDLHSALNGKKVDIYLIV